MSDLIERIRKKIKSAAPAISGQTEKRPDAFWGMMFFLLVLLGLSFLSCLGFEPKVRLFVAGEIATQDVAADQNLQIEDSQATQSKREQVSLAQPPVFDLSPKPFSSLKKNVEDILGALTNAGGEELEKVRWQISEKLNTEIGYDTIELWQRPDFRELILERLLPWLGSNYESGVVSSSGVLLPYKNGLLVRELPSKMETVRLDLADIQDLNDVKQGFETLLKVDLKKSFRVRKAVYALIYPFIIPNLTFNQELTQFRRREVMNAVEPLYYNIIKGEVIFQGVRLFYHQPALSGGPALRCPGQGHTRRFPAGLDVHGLAPAALRRFGQVGRIRAPAGNQPARPKHVLRLWPARGRRRRYLGACFLQAAMLFLHAAHGLCHRQHGRRGIESFLLLFH
jgi:cyclic-di-AMP phosphodiesterase PgpH